MITEFLWLTALTLNKDEKEALRDEINSKNHSFGEMILYPFSMSKSMTVNNKMELRFAAMSMMNAIQNTTGNKVSLICGFSFSDFRN